MDKYQEIYDTLSGWNREYQLANNRQKTFIEQAVRGYVNNLPSNLYMELNDGCPQGAFKHGHFDSEMEQALRTLRSKIGK